MSVDATLPQDRARPQDILDGYRSSVLAALSEARVLPGASRYAERRAEVTRMGARALPMVRNIAGERLWEWMLAALRRPAARADCERVIGFGWLLTEWMLPNALATASARREVVELGTLANFIVTLFDQLVDERGFAPPVSLRMLERGCDGRVGALRLASCIGRPETRLLARLVVAYLTRLERLPFAGRHRELLRLVRRVAVLMYEAETRTLVMRQPGAQALRRKAALPFVVMGLPAWLAVPSWQSIAVRSHLRWLYRLGDLLSILDDLVDFVDDLDAVRPNRLTRLEADGGQVLPVDPAPAIARRASQLLDDRRRFASAHDDGQPIDDALGIVIISWLGSNAGSFAERDAEVNRVAAIREH